MSNEQYEYNASALLVIMLPIIFVIIMGGASDLVQSYNKREEYRFCIEAQVKTSIDLQCKTQANQDAK